MKISEFQDVIRRTYHERDRARGFEKDALWFVEEVGELAEAIRKGDRREMELEMADVLAWLSTLASLADIDLERVAVDRYGSGCPRCHSIPCRCPHA
ncbi:MAG: nucleotide pyrophosphohydrolase [Planctomycetes bacterium]|nr:nucleotide pyrophosphohydrolase [Planctomycetota bacterium]